MTDSGQASIGEADARRWLSAPRYARYRRSATDDHDLAMALYVWNSQVAAGGIVDVGHLEISLRNAYDNELSTAYPDWSIDPASLLFRQEQGLHKARARQRARNKASLERIVSARRGLGAAPRHSEVVAALPFGFWSSLTLPERAPLIWNPHLHRVYPAGTRRADVHELVTRIVRFRNRLAHNEPVFSTRTGFVERMSDLRTLMELIDPAVAQFVAANSTVERVVRMAPVQGLIGF